MVISSLDRESLLKLDLSENRLGKVAMRHLCAFLQSMPCLEVGCHQPVSRHCVTSDRRSSLDRATGEAPAVTSRPLGGDKGFHSAGTATAVPTKPGCTESNLLVPPQRGEWHPSGSDEPTSNSSNEPPPPWGCLVS